MVVFEVNEVTLYKMGVGWLEGARVKLDKIDEDIYKILDTL